MSGSGTNRVTAISQTINVGREPVYNIRAGHSNIPAQVITKYPIQVQTNITIEVDDLNTANMIDNVLSGNYERLQLRVKEASRNSLSLTDHNNATVDDHNDNALTDNGARTLYEFVSVTGKEISQRIGTSANGVMAITLGYVNYYNKE